MVDVIDHTRFMSLNNQSCMTRPTLISPDKYNQGCVTIHLWLV